MHLSPQKSRLDRSPFPSSWSTQIVLNILHLHFPNLHYQKLLHLLQDLFLNIKGPKGILEGNQEEKAGVWENLSSYLESRWCFIYQIIPSINIFISMSLETKHFWKREGRSTKESKRLLFIAFHVFWMQTVAFVFWSALTASRKICLLCPKRSSQPPRAALAALLASYQKDKTQETVQQDH